MILPFFIWAAQQCCFQCRLVALLSIENTTCAEHLYLNHLFDFPSTVIYSLFLQPKEQTNQSKHHWAWVR